MGAANAWLAAFARPAVLAAPAANAWPAVLAAPAAEREREVLELYRGFHRRNLHKMEPIPVFRLPG